MERRFKPELLTIFLIVFVDILGFTLILPLLPFYSESFGATPLIVGTVVSAYAVCQLISGPILGRLSDQVGRRPVLLISQVGTLAGFLMLAFAKNLWMVFLARILDGITAGNITVAQAYIADVTTHSERTRAMGMIGAAFGLGFILGPGISALFAGLHPSAPIWAACALSFLSICGSTLFLKDVNKATSAQSNHSTVSKPHHRPKKVTYRELLSSSRVRSYFTSYTAFSFSFAILSSGLALYCERKLIWSGHPFGPTQIGYLLAFSGSINLAMQTVFLGKLVKRFGEEKLVRFAFTSCMVGLMIFGLGSVLPVILIGISLNALGNSLLRPNLTGLISKNIPREQQGLALGFCQTLMSVAQIFAPLVVGALIGKEYFLLFALSASLAAALGLLSTFVHEKVSA